MTLPTNHTTARILGLTIAAAVIWSTAATNAAPALGGLSSFEVRTQFTQCGFEIADPQAPAGNQYVVVEDPGAASVRDLDYRIVMAIVYADAEKAITAHLQAHRLAEARLGERHPFSDNQGVQLLGGYGGSVWRGNVALVQTSSATLASMWSYDIQSDEARVARPELFDMGFVSSTTEYAVDRDFVTCLEDGLATAGSVQQTSIAPIFLPGRPW